MAAEYILSEGNYNVMLCERGVRTFSDFSRNTLDLAVVPAVKKRSHLPIFVDPATAQASATKSSAFPRRRRRGRRWPAHRSHHEPDKALSDGMQSLLPRNSSPWPTKCAKLPPSSTARSTDCDRLIVASSNFQRKCFRRFFSNSPALIRFILVVAKLLLRGQPGLQMFSPCPMKDLQDDSRHSFRVDPSTLSLAANASSW